MPLTDMNLGKLMEQYRCDDRCRSILEELRWPEGPECPRCSGKSVSRIAERAVLECNATECRYQFSATVGTILHDTKLPLWKWFLAAYLMCESRKGISANQLKRMLNVSYKTAWYLCHRIRAAMGAVEQQPLTGTVQVDESYLEIGRAVPKRRGRGTGRPMVVGAVNCSGEIRLRVAPSASKEHLHRFVEDHASEAAALHTDDWPAYDGSHPNHEVINKTQEGYVSAAGVNTNAIESVWSLFKRSIVGSYHNLSTKHLPAYLDEMEWRFNNRSNRHIFRDTLVAMLESKGLPFVQLTKHGA